MSVAYLNHSLNKKFEALYVLMYCFKKANISELFNQLILYTLSVRIGNEVASYMLVVLGSFPAESHSFMALYCGSGAQRALPCKRVW